MGTSPSSGARDLSGRTSRGAVLTVAVELLVKGLAVAAVVVVGRYLVPESYGAVVLAMAIFGFTDVLSNPALMTALLREPDLSSRSIDAAWTLAVGRGLLLTLLFWALAPLLAASWPSLEVELCLYLRILACNFALQGLQNLHLVRLRREMRFGRALLLESLSPVTTSVFVLVSMVLVAEPVWLVAAQVAGPFVGALASLAFMRERPRICWDRAVVRRLWLFTLPLMVNSAMGYVLNAGDDVFVGYLAGTAALGLYSLSHRWANMGVKLVAQGLQGVLMPVYVEMRGDPARTRHVLTATLSTLTAVCALVSVLFLAFAEEFFAVVGGSAWSGAGLIAKALVPYALCNGINACLTPVFLVHGKPQWLTRLIAGVLLVFFPALYLGHQVWGVPGLALAVSALGVISTVILVLMAQRLIGLTPRRVLAATLPALFVAGLAGLVGWVSVLGTDSGMLRLVIGGGVTCLGFVLLWELFCRHALSRSLPSRSFFAIAEMLGR